MICFPNAKINLGLSIFDKRSDGMHNIETCLIPIPLYDILEIKPSNEFSLTNSGIQISANHKDNLISKTWEQLLSCYSNINPVDVYLYKNIPIGSGLGGGSSNAAFFLKAVNKLNNLGLSLDEMELIIRKVGADCPFFIQNKSVVATGIGNVFCPITNPIHNMYITLIFPQINMSTKEAYGNINLIRDKVIYYSNNHINNILISDITKWKNELKNDFEDLVAVDFPEIFEIKYTLYDKGAFYASLTGSGSSIYAVSHKPLNIDELKNKYLTWSVFID